jgi:hypothetical protein
VIVKARRVFVLGQRSCYPVAFHFAYVFGLAGGRTRLLDAPGGTGSDALRDAQKGDALLAISVKPYTRTTVEVTRHAARCGVSVVAITDSAVSPLARAARATILVPTDPLRGRLAGSPAATLPAKGRERQLAATIAMLSAGATIGAATGISVWTFIPLAVMGASWQAWTEIADTELRIPAAMAVLALLLSTGNVSPNLTAGAYGAAFASTHCRFQQSGMPLASK